VAASSSSSDDRICDCHSIPNYPTWRNRPANLALSAAALYLQISAAPLKGTSIGGHLVPVIYGFSDGGMKPGDALMAAGQIAESVAAASLQGAAMAATIGQFERRKQDWELQKELASQQFPIASNGF
jgi:hypothetical protein